MIGLNLGSGQRPFTSTAEMVWINVDSQEKWNPDIQCDASKIPYDDESVDFVVLHHVLEHFGCGEASGLIKEAHRVLRRSGSLIVCVPNLTALCRGWEGGKIDTQIFVTNLYGAYMGSEDDRHKWAYTAPTLYDFLKSSAPDWSLIQSFNFRKIPGADIAEDWWILGLEARK